MQNYEKLSRKEGVKGGIRAALSFILTATALSGAHPFGIAYAVSSFDLLIWRYGGAFLGYLVTCGEQGILYAAATAILFACALVFRGSKLKENRFFMPGCLFFCVLFVKSTTLFSAFSAAKLVSVVFEGIFSFGAALLFAAARDKEEGTARDFSYGLLTVAALAAASPLKKYVGIDLAAVAACFSVLRTGSFYGGAAGAGAGAFFGALLDLNAGGGPKYCLIYCLGGLLCGVFASSKKGARYAVWATGCALPALWTSRGAECALILAECLLTGGVYYTFVNEKARAEKRVTDGKNAAASLGHAADALLKLGETVAAGKEKASFDPSDAVQSAADAVCRACPRSSVCWNDEYLTTAGVFAEMSRNAGAKGSFQKDGLPSYFIKSCLRADELCAEVEKRLSSSRHRRELRAVKTEGEALMKRQYEGTAALLRDVARNSGRAFRDADGVGRVIKAYYPRSRWESYCDGHRFVIDVYPGADCADGDGFAAAGSLSLAVGCKIEPPETINTYGGRIVRFVRRERFAAEGAAAVRPKEGEKVSGDSVRRLYTQDGRAVVVMSDGMGTGEGAHELSAAATDLIADLVLSGASLKSAVCAVLPVLEARFERSGFVTLDALELDLFCGGATFIKCGAPPSLIIRGDGEEKIAGNSLPAGLREEPAVIYSKIKAGDTVIMATDGVTMKKGLRGSPGEICGELTEGASEDDAAAVVLRLRDA